MKKIFSLFVVGVLNLLLAGPALAHVAVKPAEVGVGAFETFSVGVPNEKDVPTIGLRLVIPEGLEHVSPNVKPGWNIQTNHAEEPAASGESVEEDEHSEAPVIEIVWTNGSIPAGQRDDFVFSAKAPAKPGELIWKAYQTYADGTVVAWDLSADAQPKNEDGTSDFSKSGPFSKTKIVDDVSNTKIADTTMVDGDKTNLPLILSGIAVVLSGFSLGMSLRKK